MANPVVVGVGAGLGATLVVVAGVFGVQALRGGGESSPAPPVTSAPTVVADPTLGPVDAPLGALDDGIADDEYPPLLPPIAPGYPEAHEMRNWVWDKVGPRWAVVIYSEGVYWDVDLRDVGPAGIYLMSPEGEYFQIADVRDRKRDGLAVLTWREDAHEITVVSNSWAGGPHYVVNLDTGKFTPLTITRDGRASDEVKLLGASGAGAELWSGFWSDVDAPGSGFDRWDPANGMVPVSDVGREVFAPFSWSLLTGDGQGVVLGVHDVGDSTFTGNDSGPVGQPRFLVYDLDSAKTTLVKPAYLSDRLPCYRDYYDFDWGPEGSVLLACNGGAVKVDLGTGAVKPAKRSDWSGNSSDNISYPGVSLVKVPKGSQSGSTSGRYRSLTYTSGATKVMIDFQRDAGAGGARVYDITEIEPGYIKVETDAGTYVIDGARGSYVTWFASIPPRRGESANSPSRKSFGEGSVTEYDECGC